MAEQLQVPSVGFAPDLFRLDGRVALVTGGAGLLGQRYCEALMQAGANVVVGDLDAVRAAALAAQLNRANGAAEAVSNATRSETSNTAQALGVGLDVTDQASANHTVRAAVEAFGRLDILVNNAALTVRGGSERLSPADYFAPVRGLQARGLGPGACASTSRACCCARRLPAARCWRQDPPAA